MLFIPINNLNNIIYEWVNNYFVPSGLRTLLICGDGYLYFDSQGNKLNLDLQGACDYIRNGLVDIIPSTSSGYRALDFPGLENIFLIQGICAGVTLQCIGKIICLLLLNSVKIYCSRKYRAKLSCREGVETMW